MFKQKSESGPAAIKVEPADATEQARTRARHRLIGAAVLLIVAVIGFPLVFETQPRPIPVDIPIEIPRRDTAPPLVMPAAPQPLPARASAPAAPPAVVATASSAAPASAVDAKIARVQESRAASAPRAPARTAEPMVVESAADAGREVPATKPASASDGARAQAILDGRAVAPAATEAGRFVVQVGAFADAEAARETRKNVEKLGLKTYTQVAQTPSGSRIRVRVGPFASRAEADAALAKAKSAGLAAVVLTL